MRALLAVIALISQMTLGSLVLPDHAAAEPATALQAALVVCGGSAARPEAPRHHRRPVQDAACPLDLAADASSAVLPPAVAVPAPRPAMATRMTALPSARAPPGFVGWTLRARGPPRLA